MFTPMGYRELLKWGSIFLIIGIVFLILGLAGYSWCYWLIIIPVINLLFVLYFFRDPERIIPEDNYSIVSPADGVVTHIDKIMDPAFEEESLRISIFLSVFDVHLNRTSYKGTVERVEYKKGEFLNAMGNDSLHRNEANLITFKTDDEKMPFYGIRQIAGLIARKIVCTVNTGDILDKGKRIGMMKFSSRTDLILPASTSVDIKVKIGDKVYAGTSIIGIIQE